MTNKEILDLEFESGDLNTTISIRDFFKKLLTTLFEKGECFSGKRPFGNSGWDWDLKICLVKNAIIKGEYDSKYDDWDFDSKEADKKILELISELH